MFSIIRANFMVSLAPATSKMLNCMVCTYRELTSLCCENAGFWAVRQATYHRYNVDQIILEALLHFLPIALSTTYGSRPRH